MSYDVVIATRNRPAALSMSLPLIAAQTEKPAKIIIVDSSEEKGPILKSVDEALNAQGVEYQVVSSSASSALQRNIGLGYVTAPIVMLPDDDSLWYPDTAEQTLNVYRLDVNEVVYGVTAAPTGLSPLNAGGEAYKKSRRRIIKSAFQPMRDLIEDRLFEPPFRRYPRNLWKNRNIPDWIDGKSSKLVEYITGFRMSYRSEVLKEVKFDEMLGYWNRYAQFEDADVSLRMQQKGGLLVSAERSRVFHHVFPSRRANGFDYGFMNIANYMYIACKVIPRGSDAWMRLDRYLRYKLNVYRLARDDYGKGVYAGALAAWKARARLLEAPMSQIETEFKRLCDIHRRNSLSGNAAS